MATGTVLALAALLSGGALAPPSFPADSPAVRLTLAQVKARLAAGTEQTPPDLSRVDVSGLDLSGIDFKRANLAGARLVGVKLPGANLFTCDLTDAVLDDADLTKANLDGSVLRRASLQRANLTGASLFATIIEAADLSGAQLSGTRIIGYLRSAKLVGANLTNANIAGYLVNENMEPLSADETYQLWAIVGEGDAARVISAGVLGADPRGAPFKVDGPVTGLALTVESSPGVPVTANDPVAVGRFA